MRRKIQATVFTFFISFFSFFSFFSPSATADPAPLSEADAVKLATEAYLYAYPLITMDITRQVMTNVLSPETYKAPMGQFAHSKQFPDGRSREMTTPNTDTLLSTAWIDVSTEPYILHLPTEGSRYYLISLLSSWSEVFANIGKRSGEVEEIEFAITGPNWKGKLPPDVVKLKSPTNLVWIIARTYANGTAEDEKIVQALQNEYHLTPLHAYNQDDAAVTTTGQVDSHINMKTAVRNQVNALDAAAYFKQFSVLLQNNPPVASDAAMVEKLARLGIIPGQEFNLSQQSPLIAAALTEAVKLGQEKIAQHIAAAGVNQRGWQYLLKAGRYETDYLQRATIAAIGLGATLPEDTVFAMRSVDSTGKPLTGANHYRVHFNRGELPPVRGLWSLALYDDKYFFVENALNRFSLNTSSALKRNDDGSIDLWIQHDSPSTDKESNWLPAPTGNFNLMLSLYWPKRMVLKNDWEIPQVQQVQ